VWPLVASLLFANITATLVAYGIALVLDAVFIVAWFKRALSLSKRAARGETFSLQAGQSVTTRGIPAKH
jgi:hypothetical protein